MSTVVAEERWLADRPVAVRRTGAERATAIGEGDRIVVALPAASPVADFSLDWWRLDAEGRPAGSGRWPDPALEEALARPDPTRRVLAIAPASATALHWLAMPDLAPRQARVAARIKVLDEAAAGADELHVAAGEHRLGDDAIAVAVVDRALMVDWLDWCARHRLDPDVIVPAPLLLPQPAPGTVERGPVGGEIVLRGEDSGWASDEALDDLLIGDDRVVDASAEALEARIAAAFEAPPVNLRSGPFAKRRRGIDRRMVARVLVVLALCGLIELLIALILIARLSLATDAADAQARALAGPAVPAGTAVEQIVPTLDAALARRGGGPNSFSVPLAGLYQAMSASPSAIVTDLSYTPDGTLSATLNAPTTEGLNTVLLALQRDGYTVSATTSQGTDGRAAAAITVRGSKL